MIQWKFTIFIVHDLFGDYVGRALKFNYTPLAVDHWLLSVNFDQLLNYSAFKTTIFRCASYYFVTTHQRIK